MNKIRLAVLVTLAVAALGILGSFLVPLPKDTTPFNFYSDLTLSISAVVLYLGASIIITMGFGAFTSKLRRPYTVIFVGLSIGGVAYLELSVLAVIGQLGSAIYGTLTVIPFIASAMLTFIGTRMLARAFGVKNITMNWFFALGAVIAASLVLGVLPHAASATPEMEFDIANALNIWAIILFGFGAYHVLLIKKQASVGFMNALAWLCLSMFVTSVVAGGGSTLFVMLFGDAAEQIILLVALTPSVIAAALFLRSAYSFNKIVESADLQGLSVARNFFGKPVKPRAEAGTTSVDVVTYAAGLVSNPGEIDSLLDRVRVLTSHLQTGQHIEGRDDQTLMDVYLQIENYLVTKESLRVFSRDGLRQDIAQKLRLTAEGTNTFWPKLSQQ